LKTIDTKYWLSDQRVTQRIATQAFPAFPAPNLQLATVRVRNLFASIPSWLILIMILLAVLATAATVIGRMRSELQFSTLQYQRTASEIELLRRGNATLGVEIRRLTNDPSMIESEARSRLGMVRPSDIVVPTELAETSRETSKESSTLGTLSFAR
jgi:cell division protein FtsB